MSGYDWYIFFLCLVVFTLLTGLFSVMLYYVIKLTIKAINHGLEDERIITEYQKNKARGCFSDILCRIVSGILLAVILAAFAASVFVQLSGNYIGRGFSAPKVVMSASMSFKHEENTYLEEHGLNDQFDTFDLVFLEQLPGEFELELYDIVVYDYHGELVIHRIVGIEEPNEKHPDCRYFKLQGDASKYMDEFPVLYEQMRACYNGKHIKFVGSFFAFMQSPAGYLCILLVLFAVFATPVAEKKLLQAKLARLTEIGVIQFEEQAMEVV
ncbi:MAG: hypothetical protein IKC95_05110 [Oscillospiraceae bacterium]|nr:hypothetical protein [Oscillospiraceae bacterium]